MIPQVHRNFRVAAADTGNQVVLEGLDCTFGSVYAMQMWRGELESYTFLAHEGFQSGWSFIVQSLKKRAQSTGCELGMQGGVRSNEFVFAA